MWLLPTRTIPLPLCPVVISLCKPYCHADLPAIVHLDADNGLFEQSYQDHPLVTTTDQDHSVSKTLNCVFACSMFVLIIIGRLHVMLMYLILYSMMLIIIFVITRCPLFLSLGLTHLQMQEVCLQITLNYLWWLMFFIRLNPLCDVTMHFDLTVFLLWTPAGRNTNDTSHRPEHKLVHCIPPDFSYSEAEVSVLSKGLKFVPLKPSDNKYNVIHDYEHFCELTSLRKMF